MVLFQTEEEKEELEDMKRKIKEKFEDKKAKNLVAKVTELDGGEEEDLESLLWKDKRDAEKAKM